MFYKGIQKHIKDEVQSIRHARQIAKLTQSRHVRKDLGCEHEPNQAPYDHLFQAMRGVF